MPNGVTTYSPRLPGAPQNYEQAVRFDMTNGCLGITQFDGEKVADRVLLSPKQVKELLKFLDP